MKTVNNRCHRWNRHSQTRQGVAALWVILTIPIMVILTVIVVEVGNLWLARMELENALEAAVLAGAEEWGSTAGGDTLVSRQVAASFAASNPVRGDAIALDLNYNPAATNDNTSLVGELVFGAATFGPNGTFFFEPLIEPDGSAAGAGDYAVRAQRTVEVSPIVSSLFGYGLPTFEVSAISEARYSGDNPQLIVVSGP